MVLCSGSTVLVAVAVAWRWNFFDAIMASLNVMVIENDQRAIQILEKFRSYLNANSN